MAYLESVPSFREIAERLSLIQRWNGRTTIPWTVLQHTILAATLLPDDALPHLRLTVLLHDAAEGWTGDIPRGFKCPEQVDLENDILAEIYLGHRLVPVWTQSVKRSVRYVDDFAAMAEAQCFCHPVERRAVSARHLSAHIPNTALVERGENILWGMRDLPRAEAINLWVKAVERTLADMNIPEEERI
ncbi:MAG: hypothetical protein V3S55_10110 [Nitrospiraceae bacterium]